MEKFDNDDYPRKHMWVPRGGTQRNNKRRNDSTLIIGRKTVKGAIIGRMLFIP